MLWSMKNTNKTIVLLFCLCMAKIASSQTVSWQQRPCWDAVEMLGDNLLKVSEAGGWGVCRLNGTTLVPCDKSMITNISDGCYIGLDSEGKLRFIGDEYGNINSISGSWFVDMSWPYFSDGLLAVRDASGSWGYMNRTGKLVIQNQFRNAFPFHYGYASVCNQGNKGWNFIDVQGDYLLKSGFSHLSFASSFTRIEGQQGPLAFIVVESKIKGGGAKGYMVDVKGEIQGNVIPKEGVAYTELQNRHKFLCGNNNTSLEVDVNDVLEIIYVSRNDRQFSCRPVQLATSDFPNVNMENIYVDGGGIQYGNLVVAPQFQEVTPLSSELFLVKQANKLGLIKFRMYNALPSVSCQEGSKLNVFHAIEIPFMVSNSFEKIRAYAVDKWGETGFFNINNSGRFSVPIKYLDEEGRMQVGLEIDGILIAPEDYHFKVKYGKGFEVTGPQEASVGKVGHSSFNINIKNKSSQEAKPFDVFVGDKLVDHVDGLQPFKSISVAVVTTVRIDELEDSENKIVSVVIREDGLPRQTYSIKILFKKVYNNEE